MTNPSPYYIAEICFRLGMPQERVEWLIAAIQHQGYPLTGDIDQDTRGLHPWIPVVEQLSAEN